MKVKILTLLAIIFLLGNVSSAQGVGAYKAKKTEVVKKRNPVPQREGFFIMPEIEIGSYLEFDIDDFHYKINAIFGYEFNNHFSLGVGAGFNSTNIRHYKKELMSYLPLKMNYLPLYMNIHGDMFKAKTSLYYSLDLGVAIPMKKNGILLNYYYYDDDYRDYYCYEELYHKGLMISPEIGVRTNNCYFGINCLIAKTHRCWYEDVVYDYSSEEMMSGRLAGDDISYQWTLSIKFGYKIPLNLKR